MQQVAFIPAVPPQKFLRAKVNASLLLSRTWSTKQYSLLIQPAGGRNLVRPN